MPTVRKIKRFLKNNLTLHLNKLEKEQNRLKVHRGKEIIKIREEIHEIETRKTVEEKINEELCFFKKDKQN